MLRGVGGGFGVERMRKRGLKWWDEGMRMVCGSLFE